MNEGDVERGLAEAREAYARRIAVGASWASIALLPIFYGMDRVRYQAPSTWPWRLLPVAVAAVILVASRRAASTNWAQPEPDPRPSTLLGVNGIPQRYRETVFPASGLGPICTPIN